MQNKAPVMFISFLLLTLILLAAVKEAEAIPAFARKYGFECTMCHSNFPRLNDFGDRYRQNGYQVPDLETADKTVLEGYIPFAARISGGLTLDDFNNSNDPAYQDVKEFRINTVDLLAAGLLARNIGVFMVYPPKIEESTGVDQQPGTIEMANVIFSNVIPELLNVRVGRFEPAYVPFSVKRSLTVSPYEIYAVASPLGVSMSNTQTGLELTGYTRTGLSYAGGWVNGSDNKEADDSPADFYARVAQVIGNGGGQTAGQRIGLTGYYGKASKVVGDPRESVIRAGVDASLNYKVINLGVQYLWGQDRKADTNNDNIDFSGGFAELSYLPATYFVGFARYDWVNTQDDLSGDSQRWTVGGRYYFADPLALHCEYSNRNKKVNGNPDLKENFFTTRLDFIF